VKCPHCGESLASTDDGRASDIVSHLIGTVIGERARQIAERSHLADVERISAVAYLAARDVWDVLDHGDDDLAAVHEFLALEESLILPEREAPPL
jgi:hypothetical protein